MIILRSGLNSSNQIIAHLDINQFFMLYFFPEVISLKAFARSYCDKTNEKIINLKHCRFGDYRYSGGSYSSGGQK